MLIDSEGIKQTKKQIEIMQAFIDGKEIEYKENFSSIWSKTTIPKWNFGIVEYRIKSLEPEFVYPIYKRLKQNPETVVKFHSIDTGIYVSVRKSSIYKPGDIASNMAPHTDSVWEDYAAMSPNEEKTSLSSDTIELFEVMVYYDIMKEFIIKQVLYSDEELKNYRNSIKTGRSFIINKETKQIIKVNYN